MKRLLFISLLLLCIIPLWSQSYTLENIPNPKHEDVHTYVSNPDNILSSHTAHQLNTLLDSLEQQTSTEVAVVALNSIGNENIKTFATGLFEHWGVGKSEKDNGFLVLFVMDQRKITFETGYGLEGVLPDALCKRIQMEYMVPEFKNGDYDKGILNGVEQIVAAVKNEPVPSIFETPASIIDTITPYLLTFCVFTILLCGYIISLLLYVKKRSDLSNTAKGLELKKKSVGLFSTIGCLVPFGITFLILFTNLLWIGGVSTLATTVMLILSMIPSYFFEKKMETKIANTPNLCPDCGIKMDLLTDKEKSNTLNERQKVELKIKSILHEPCYCPQCKQSHIFSYVLKSKYTPCPKCSARAYYFVKTVTTLMPTYHSTGSGKSYYKCACCNYSDSITIVLPKKTATSSGSSSSGGSFGGGSRSSGGSFGGGRSGGGGSTSSW